MTTRYRRPENSRRRSTTVTHSVPHPLQPSYRAEAIRVIVCLLLALTTLPGPLRGQECIEYGEFPTLVGDVVIPDRAIGVAVAGSYAYIAAGFAGLVVVDFSDPASPAIVGSADTPGFATGVAVSGSHAYVADSNSLEVVDISDPAAPAIVGTADTPGGCLDVTVAGTHAYVADGSAGLQVVDISDPLAPAIVGDVDTPGDAQGVAVAGTHAYVADYAFGLHVVDISDPLAPTIVGTADTPGNAGGVAVAGSYAYVADQMAGLQVVDISNPVVPAIVGSVDTPGLAFGVAVAGSHVYVADGSSGLFVLLINCEPTTSVSDQAFVPSAAMVHPNFPNPFTQLTVIRYHLPLPAQVSLRIYSISGRLVRVLEKAATKGAGEHSVLWDGRDDRGRRLAPGVYLYRLESGRYREAHRMVHLE